MADQKHDDRRYDGQITSGTRRSNNDDLPADALTLPAVLNVRPSQSKA
jgi:hypothetical protein